jgi:spore coat protein A
MRPSRREFLQIVAATGAASMFPSRSAYAYYASPGTPIKGQNWPGISKYATAFRGVGPGGIPIAAPDGIPAFAGATHYSLRVGEFKDQLHPSLGPTTLWGYNPSAALGGGLQPQRHLGGIIVAQRGQPVQLTITNALPAAHPLPVDISIPAVGGFPDALTRFNGSGHNAISSHLHGGFVPWFADGGPMAWFTPGAQTGESYVKAVMQTLNPALGAGQGEYYYPNNQSARLMWYHDHAHDITRLNAYAGIASAYVLRDGFEGGLRNLGLPDFVENGGNEIPLIVQDKIFVGPDITIGDPTWSAVTTAKSQTVGSLWYPHVYEKSRWKYTGNVVMPDPSCIPEMFGDTMLVNGTVYPVANIEAKRYRVRFLNACQARFLNLQLYQADTTRDGITYSNAGVPLNPKGPDFLVIGTEGGFLPHPVAVPGAQPYNPLMLINGLPNLITAPAERWDLIVDFTAFAGTSVILYTDAPAPFPMAAAGTDFYAGTSNGVRTKPGYGPDTRIMMRFNVGGLPATSDPRLSITPATDLSTGIDPFLVGVSVQNGAVALAPGVSVRSLTLNEAFDSLGRLIQLVGPNTLNPISPGTYGRTYMDSPSEIVNAGATEVWQIANLTGDTHPIHFHLVNCQVVARQPFNVAKYTGAPIYSGPARGADPTEIGWKETVKMHPGEVTTVIMKFDLPTCPFTVPASPRTGGAEYVWHCHILEHEEHDMMRPLVVI